MSALPVPTSGLPAPSTTPDADTVVVACADAERVLEIAWRNGDGETARVTLEQATVLEVYAERVLRSDRAAREVGRVKLIAARDYGEADRRERPLGINQHSEGSTERGTLPPKRLRETTRAIAADAIPREEFVAALAKFAENTYIEAKRWVGKRLRELRRAGTDDAPVDTEADLRVCAVADLTVAEPVDAIITDPPYPREHLSAYADLAAFAARSLRPGGLLAAMAGQSWLPEVIAALQRDDLAYHWTVAYLTPGAQAPQIWPRRINTFWKPVLIYAKGTYEGEWIGDVVRSNVNDNDKEHHDWGQSEPGMARLVERLSAPGALVVDPFLGGGTTAIVCRAKGRRFIGADIDPAQVALTRRRLAA